MLKTTLLAPHLRCSVVLTSFLLGLVGCGGGEHLNVAGPAAQADSIDAFPRTPAGKPPGASPRMYALAQQLNRGINFGNMLDAPREGDWGLTVEDEFIGLIGERGLSKAVRLPVRWSNHASADASATISPAFFARVDRIVDRLLSNNATVVLNMHHYRQLDGDKLDAHEFAVAPEVVRVRFLSMWKQIAARYADRSDRLIFELYNEPHGALDAHWNDLLSRAVRTVRTTNPSRAIVIGPTTWNNAYDLPKLELPPDPHLILTVHHYEPFDFTHQGADWISPKRPTGVPCCNDEQRKKMTDILDVAQREAATLGYPVFIGEFGAYSKAPEASRIEYARYFRQETQRRGLPWMYWELAAGFGVYDPIAKQFRYQLKEALYGN